MRLEQHISRIADQDNAKDDLDQPLVQRAERPDANRNPQSSGDSQWSDLPKIEAAPVTHEIDRIEREAGQGHQRRSRLDADDQRNQRHGHQRKAEAGSRLQQSRQEDDTEQQDDAHETSREGERSGATSAMDFGHYNMSESA